MIYQPDRKVRVFSLKSEFIDKFRGKQPKWGPVGYFTYKRSYALKKPDGTQEEFFETCQRVVEGVYNLQKIHCRTHGLPWNEPKAQRSAQEMFQRMWDFKWTPPGRGLDKMGTDAVYKKGGAMLNNPLHKDTPVLTREQGWVPLGTLAGMPDVTLLSSKKLYGREHDSTTASAVWVSASVSELEMQPCKKLSFQDNSGFRTEIVTSENHRWFRRTSVKKHWERVCALDLQVGDQVPLTMPAKMAPVSVFGAQHGFFFGDGTRSNGELHQFGDSVKVLQHLFESQAQPVDTRRDDEWVVRNCPRTWGTPPVMSEDISYIYGFLAGYFAADGCVGQNGSCSLSSARQSELQVVRQLFLACGIRVGEIRLSSESSSFLEQRELWAMAVHNHDLWPEFFLQEKHLRRWEERGVEPRRKYARLVSIQDAGEQPVLCATVPEYEQFVVSGFILTSNCAFISTERIGEDFAAPFTFLMDMSMLGVGVGGDTKGAGKATLRKPKTVGKPFVVEDSREGWVTLAKTVLNSFVGRALFPETIDVTLVRERGAPLKTFGGTSSGPGPLVDMVKGITRLLLPAGVTVQFEESRHPNRVDEPGYLRTSFTGKGGHDRITSSQIVDVFNYIGKCVVAGGIRRTAEIMFGEPTDQEFLDLKDTSALSPLYVEKAELKSIEGSPDVVARLVELDQMINTHPANDRRWASNNSVVAYVGMDYEDIAKRIANNGEPGLFWLKNAQDYGRMGDAPNYSDAKSMGCNPCAEQTLESWELCTLVETYPAHHDSYEDYERTLKFAYLYAKTVTLVPTHDPRTNAVLNRNRRIGCSMSGIRQAITKFGRREFLHWCDGGYKYIRQLDKTYSDWLGIPLSVKVTSVKPSGTVSLLCGATPGVHLPHSEYYIRNIRVHGTSPFVQAARDAGYPVERDKTAPDTWVVSFPVKEKNFAKGKNDTTIWEQMALAADLQRYWADNQVSVTVTFKKHEAKEIQTCLEVFEDRMKAVSMLPLNDHGYVQAPYIEIDQATYESLMVNITPMDMSGKKREVQDMFCDGESCQIKFN